MSHISQVFTNQSRLRDNIKSMEKQHTSELVQRYMKDLDGEEDDLISTRKIIKQLEDALAIVTKNSSVSRAQLLEAVKAKQLKL